MAVFGFSGFPGKSEFDALSEYGGGLCHANATQFHGESGTGSACWALEVASDAGVSIAIQGRPSFENQCGAATILAAYRLHGIDLLGQLEGAFALAVLDRPAGRVLLAIDRMGIERLAFATRGKGLVFSSSAESVARSPVIGARLCPQALFDYTLLHTVPAPGTIFQGVRKLPAAAYAVFANDELRVSRYWQPQFTTIRGDPFDRLRADLRRSLSAAVADETRKHEATGAFLSGGLDSSTVAGMLSQASRPARTFSIGFGYEDYDELNYARLVNNHFGCEGNEYVIKGADIVTAFPLIAKAFDEPFGNSSALPVYFCALMAREHGVGHLLAGDGGDELFAGNSRYADQRVFEIYGSVPRFLRKGALEPLLEHWPQSLAWPLVRKARGYIAQANLPLPDRLEVWNPLRRLGAAQVFSAQFLQQVDPEALTRQMRELWSMTPSEQYLHRMLYFDWQYTLADNDLRKVGTMCHLAGITVSYPMLNHAVIDLSTRIAPTVMMPGSKLRDFYKRAMRGFLPDAVIHKKKHGFGLPFGLWLQESEPLRKLIFGNLSALRDRGIMHPQFMDRLLKLHSQEDARYYGVFLWVLAMLEQWMQEHRLAP